MIPEAAVEAAFNAAVRLDISASDAYLILEAVAPHLRAEALEDAALDFEISPHNKRAKMARHFNNTYVAKLRGLAADHRGQATK